MYGIPQSGMLSKNHLTKKLATYGYILTNLTPGLWRQKIRPIYSILVVKNFEVKYVDQYHSKHLLTVWNLDPLAIEKYKVSWKIYNIGVRHPQCQAAPEGCGLEGGGNLCNIPGPAKGLQCLGQV